jgi:hypothetical protein
LSWQRASCSSADPEGRLLYIYVIYVAISTQLHPKSAYWLLPHAARSDLIGTASPLTDVKTSGDALMKMRLPDSSAPKVLNRKDYTLKTN